MVAAALLGLGVSTAPRAKAANIFWDVNSNIGGAGGTGNWDTTSAFWFNAGSGTTTTGANPTSAATFTTADTAYFTGLAGTATLQQGVTVGGLYFGTPGFTIAGANTLTLNTGATVNTVGDATISSVVAGTTFTKSGSGILTLNAINTLNGAVTLSAGTLRATTNAAALGTGSLTLSGSGSTLILANDTGLNFALNATVSASTTIMADRLTLGAGITQSLGTLSLGAVTLTSNLGNLINSGTAGLTFGATTLTGAGTINTNNSFSTPGGHEHDDAPEPGWHHERTDRRRHG